MWLRTNISTDFKESLTSEDDDPQISYTADELYIILPGICSVESIEDQFDTLWVQYGETRSIEDRLNNLEEVVNSVAAATVGLE